MRNPHSDLRCAYVSSFAFCGGSGRKRTHVAEFGVVCSLHIGQTRVTNNEHVSNLGEISEFRPSASFTIVWRIFSALLCFGERNRFRPGGCNVDWLLLRFPSFDFVSRASPRYCFASFTRWRENTLYRERQEKTPPGFVLSFYQVQP